MGMRNIVKDFGRMAIVVIADMSLIVLSRENIVSPIDKF